ncbi:MAG: hypothetical protein M3463_02705 [Verrucomicrobiota bacterium]|nr:hypothetical protein [Verrucomicrobiota bacterium]
MWKIPLPFVLLFVTIGTVAGFLIGSDGQDRHSEKEKAAAPATFGTKRPDPKTAAMVKDFERVATGILSDENLLRRSAQLYDMVAQMSATDIPGALHAAHYLEREKRDLLVNALLSRWAELDPAAATQYAFGLDENKRYYSRTTPLKLWAEKDFDAASAWVLALPPDARRNSALSGIASALARKDPAAAIRFLDQHLDSKASQGSSPFSAVLTEWAKKDFNAAAQYALGVQDRELRRNLVRSLSYSQSRDPQELLAWANGIDDRELRSQVTSSAISNWANRDPQAALTYVRTLPLSEQNRHIQSVISGLARRDIAEARRVLEEMPEGRARSSALNALMSAWIGEDANAAMTYAKSLPEGTARVSAISQVAQQVSERDHMAALELAQLLPAGSQRRSVMYQVASRWGRSDPKAAAEYFLQNPTGDDAYDSPLQSIAQSWASSNPRELLEWGRALPDEKQRNAIVSQAISGLARNDPTTAARELAQMSGPAQGNAAGNLASTWANHDPAAAASWAASLPEGEARTRAFSSLVNQWADIELPAATQWLESLPASKSRDSAVRAFASRVAESDPEAALAWAGTIADASARTSAVEQATRNWLRNDKTAATAWIQTTPLLDDKARARLLPKR